LTLTKKKRKKLISGGIGVRIQSANNYNAGVATTQLEHGTGEQLTQPAYRK
jgi:hypothetical protein